MIAMQHSIIRANQKDVETPEAVPIVAKSCINDSNNGKKNSVTLLFYYSFIFNLVTI